MDENGRFVTPDTVQEGNVVIMKVHTLMGAVKLEVQREYDDVVMAAHS